MPLRAHALAERPGQPYPTAFRTVLHSTSILNGAEGTRTPIPLRARQVLSQLSFGPLPIHELAVAGAGFEPASKGL